MRIFSHRGLGFGKPENTLDSYRTALEMGFSLEIDVQRTKDGRLVISHDTNLKRQRGIDKNLTDMSFSELIDANIPSFEDVLELFQTAGKEGEMLAIHVKDEYQWNILELVANAISKFQLEEKCFIFDLTTGGANHAKQINSRIKVALSIGEKRYTGTIYLWEDIKDNKDVDAVWWDEWYSGLYNKKSAELIKESGRLNFVISPEMHRLHNHPKGNSPEEVKKVWKSLVEWGVEGICTDCPLELKEFLNEIK
jgi:hypothetical protein